jgi:hypothetical protein
MEGIKNKMTAAIMKKNLIKKVNKSKRKKVKESPPSPQSNFFIRYVRFWLMKAPPWLCYGTRRSAVVEPKC